MAAKPKNSIQKPVRERVVDASLVLAAQLGWDHVTLQDIAGEAKVSLPELCDLYEDKDDIIVSLGRSIDRQTLEAYGEASLEEPEKDRLFGILMERFDVLNRHRTGIVAMLSGLRTNPKQAIISLPHLGRSMAWMLEGAMIDTNGVKGALRIAGLSLVYLNVLRTWMEDETEDLSKTMAALDKNLGRAEQFARSFAL